MRSLSANRSLIRTAMNNLEKYERDLGKPAHSSIVQRDMGTIAAALIGIAQSTGKRFPALVSDPEEFFFTSERLGRLKAYSGQHRPALARLGLDDVTSAAAVETKISGAVALLDSMTPTELGTVMARLFQIRQR